MWNMINSSLSKLSWACQAYISDHLV